MASKKHNFRSQIWDGFYLIVGFGTLIFFSCHEQMISLFTFNWNHFVRQDHPIIYNRIDPIEYLD